MGVVIMWYKRSFMKVLNSIGPKIELCGTPYFKKMSFFFEIALFKADTNEKRQNLTEKIIMYINLHPIGFIRYIDRYTFVSQYYKISAFYVSFSFIWNIF